MEGWKTKVLGIVFLLVAIALLNLASFLLSPGGRFATQNVALSLDTLNILSAVASVLTIGIFVSFFWGSFARQPRVNPTLLLYVRKEIKKGRTESQIASTLKKKGRELEEISTAIRLAKRKPNKISS